jgi:hypothetical protein
MKEWAYTCEHYMKQLMWGVYLPMQDIPVDDYYMSFYISTVKPT